MKLGSEILVTKNKLARTKSREVDSAEGYKPTHGFTSDTL